MVDMGASVLARLKNKAKESGRSYLCRKSGSERRIVYLLCYKLEINSIAPIAIAKKYAGIGAALIARIKNTRTPFSIDFGVGDVIVPNQEKRRIPTQLTDFAAPMVNTYSIETTVAEKLDAILSLMEFSSRMKDYYDIYYLANKFDFEGKILSEALRKTFVNREHNFTLEQFEHTVLKTIKAFLTKPFMAVVNEKEFVGKWSAFNSEWM